ncbi:MAG: type II toxin-antitoxin system ParD family antitoxin [Rhizobium sp.]|nr:type II toxin-antitoxin system ParD family antitoxin [Rhizobium sp.]
MYGQAQHSAARQDEAVRRRSGTQSGQFANEEAYIQDLISQEQDRQRDVARIQGIVDEGIASGESDESMQDILRSFKDQRSKSA